MNKDGTGPEGEGPKTGKGLGNCEEPKKEIRQLTDVEKSLIAKNLVRIKEETEYTEYVMKHSELMINEGLKQNFKKSMREFKKTLIKAKMDVAHSKDVIEQLNDQIKNGVETIPEKVEDKE